MSTTYTITSAVVVPNGSIPLVEIIGSVAGSTTTYVLTYVIKSALDGLSTTQQQVPLAAAMSNAANALYQSSSGGNPTGHSSTASFVASQGTAFVTPTSWSA